MREEGPREREDNTGDPRMAEGLWVSSTLPPAPSHPLPCAACASGVSYAWFARWALGCFLSGTVAE